MQKKKKYSISYIIIEENINLTSSGNLIYNFKGGQ